MRILQYNGYRAIAFSEEEIQEWGETYGEEGPNPYAVMIGAQDGLPGILITYKEAARDVRTGRAKIVRRERE